MGGGRRGGAGGIAGALRGRGRVRSCGGLYIVLPPPFRLNTPALYTLLSCLRASAHPLLFFSSRAYSSASIYPSRPGTFSEPPASSGHTSVVLHHLHPNHRLRHFLSTSTTTTACRTSKTKLSPSTFTKIVKTDSIYSSPYLAKIDSCPSIDCDCTSSWHPPGTTPTAPPHPTLPHHGH